MMSKFRVMISVLAAGVVVVLLAMRGTSAASFADQTPQSLTLPELIQSSEASFVALGAEPRVPERVPGPAKELAESKSLLSESWAERNLELDGVRFADVDLNALDFEGASSWRSYIREVQQDFKADFLTRLGDHYTYIGYEEFVRSNMLGSLAIHYSVVSVADREVYAGIRYVPVPPGGNSEIYSLHDAAQKVVGSAAYSAQVRANRQDLHRQVDEQFPGLSYRVEESEDGGFYALWATRFGVETIIGSQGESLVD